MISRGKAGAGTDETKETIRGRERTAKTYFGFVLLLVLYIAAAAVMPFVARSREVLVLGGARLPVSTLAGVLTSLANICIICLVVFYRKPGFIVALCILILQAPILILNSIAKQGISSMPALFSSLLTIVAILLIRSRDRRIDEFQQVELKELRERQQLSQRLLEETAEALVSAIDAKDEYSHGHSMRVAVYSERIARMMGKSDEEARKVYYAGLLHDVGKIGISDAIINKKSELTPEEYEIIKQHPVLGEQILSSIRDYPYIRVGARHHHERFDGQGYPDGLKGKEIPEIARIISVADTYDTLSSNRIYRSAMPREFIREELAAGAGTQFDPEIVEIMRRMIDSDEEINVTNNPATNEKEETP